MKIVAINGSPRKNGNTALLLNAVRQEVEAAGVEFQIFQPGPNVHPCMACYHCLDTGSLRCVRNDDGVNDIIAACVEADGILLASPVYHAGIAGGMKCVIDRLMLAAGCGENQFRRKVGGALCTLRRSGGTETYHQLLAAMDCMEMVIVTSDYWGVVHGAEPGEVLKDAEGMEVAAKLGRNMAWMVKVLAESKVPAPESAPRPMMNFIR
ncbi:flavodoxin family protein [uncultured Dysosmobacter sp.]|uniref:flavodoxin family protein n=1 Tax=uncultured Dysosmobacter sp. TaxID=2591384 RepID=UPI00263450B6|nr:flavodoxin family protein [uncultured Dysosmobacter sp.]